MTLRMDRFGRPALVWLLARLILGGIIFYAGLQKTLHPEGFLKLVRQYDMVADHRVLNLVAVVIPWFEVYCGLLLIGGIAVRGTALLSLLMLVPFTVIVLQRALAIQSTTGTAFCSIAFDCGCGTGVEVICYKAIFNGMLILLSCALLAIPRKAGFVTSVAQ